MRGTPSGNPLRSNLPDHLHHEKDGGNDKRRNRPATLDTAGALASAIHQAGPDAETALVSMIRANNLAEAWAQCKKTATSNTDGRRVCSMPMWADPEPQPRD